jgi:hypothetical protein
MEKNKNLNVYSLSDHNLIATYELGGECYAGIIADDRLFLSANEKLLVF